MTCPHANISLPTTSDPHTVCADCGEILQDSSTAALTQTEKQSTLYKPAARCSRTDNQQGAMTMTTAEAAVVDADGTFGTHATVWFSGSLADCRAYAKRSRSVVVVCGCSKPVGSQITKHALKTLTQAGLWKVMR